MYIKPNNPDPIGINPPNPEDRKPIFKLVNGDKFKFTSTLTNCEGEPVTPDNSILCFILSDDRFCINAIYTATWNDGIQLVDQQNNPGLVEITIPEEITASLRRGAYIFSLSVTDTAGRKKITPITGTFLVEYEPTSPHQDIPYRKREPAT